MYFKTDTLKFIVSSLFLILSSWTVISCSRPPEREAVISSKIQEDVFELKKMSDLSQSESGSSEGAATRVSATVNLENERMIGRFISVQEVKSDDPTMEFEKAERYRQILFGLKKENKIVFTLLNNSIQFYQILTPEEVTEIKSKAQSEDVEKLWDKKSALMLKELSFLDDNEENAAEIGKMESALKTSRKTLMAQENKKIENGLLFIGEAKCKYGKLENEITDFGEVKSTLGFVETKIHDATHILLEYATRSDGEKEKQ